MDRDIPRRVLLVCLMGSLLQWSGISMAQDAAEQVTVMATRTPKPADEIAAAISVVAGEDVQLARQQLGLDESLARVPGLFMQNRYNFAQDLRMSIRGFGARANFGIRGIRIFVDGIPETLPDGQGQVDSIDLGSVERITVLRGAASALYGNASGGVILIDSQDAPAEPSVEARLSWGELGFSKHQLKAGAAAGRVGYQVNLADLEMDGFREHSAVESRSANGKLSFAPEASSSLEVAFNYTDQPLADDPGALTRELAAANPRQASAANVAFAAGESLEQTRLGFVYDKSFGERHAVTARNYYVWRSFENTLPFQAGGAVAIDRFFAGGGLMYTNRGTPAGRENRFIAGVDVDAQDDDRQRFDNDFGSRGERRFSQNERVHGSGIFVQDELRLRDDTTLTLGVRHDSVRLEVRDRFLSDGDDSGKRTLERTSPMAGLLYAATPRINLYASVSTSFETPTTTELADPDGGGGFNPDLDPQTAVNYELGLKGSAGGQTFYTLALFAIDVRDELIPFEIAGSPGRSFFRNAGESRREGMELSVATTPADGLDLSLAYTYSDFAFEEFVDEAGNDFRGNTLPGLPVHVLHAAASYRHASGFYSACDALYVDEIFLDNANTASDGAYALANLRLGYSASRGPWRWSVFTGVNNLFDEAYHANTRINAFAGRYFEPGPRRNLYGGASFRYHIARER